MRAIATILLITSVMANAMSEWGCSNNVKQLQFQPLTGLSGVLTVKIPGQDLPALTPWSITSSGLIQYLLPIDPQSESQGYMGGSECTMILYNNSCVESCKYSASVTTGPNEPSLSMMRVQLTQYNLTRTRGY